MQASHILSYWNPCAEEEWEWAGLGGLSLVRTGRPNSTPAALCLCHWPSQVALVKTCQFSPLGPFSHFGGKKGRKKNPCQFWAKPMPMNFMPNYYLYGVNASFFSTDVLSVTQVGGGSPAQANSSLRPRVFSTFPCLLTKRSKGCLISVTYTCGSSSFCYDLLPSRSILKLNGNIYLVTKVYK